MWNEKENAAHHGSVLRTSEDRSILLTSCVDFLSFFSSEVEALQRCRTANNLECSATRTTSVCNQHD